MRTPTNHEDNQLFREAGKVWAQHKKIQREINALVNLRIDSLMVAMREDFALNDAEIAKIIQEKLDALS